MPGWNQDCWEKQQQPQICRWNHPNGRKWRGNKEPPDEGERGEWKSWLKTQHSKNEDHGIWSHHFMANGWGKMETVTDFIFLGSKITMHGDWSREIKRHLLLGKKAMTNLDSVLKSGDITLSAKVHIVKALVFPVVMYGCESWTKKKKAKCRKLMLLNCGVGEDSWESLGLQGDPTSPFWRSALGFLWNECC